MHLLNIILWFSKIIVFERTLYEHFKNCTTGQDFMAEHNDLSDKFKTIPPS